MPVCPFGLLDVVDGVVTLADGCTLCGACVDACDFEVISIEDARAAAAATDDYKGVWVFAERRRDRVRDVAFELLAKGRELADALKLRRKRRISDEERRRLRQMSRDHSPFRPDPFSESKQTA